MPRSYPVAPDRAHAAPNRENATVFAGAAERPAGDCCQAGGCPVAPPPAGINWVGHHVSK